MYFHLFQLLLISNSADVRLVCIPVSSLPSTLQHHHSEMKPNVPRSPTGACLPLFSNISISFRNLAPSAYKWYIFCSERTSHPDSGWTFSILITVTPALTCIRLGVAVLFMHPRAPCRVSCRPYSPKPRLRHTKENDVVVASTANVLFWEAAPNPDVTDSTPGPLLQITLSHASPPFSSDPATPSFCPDILHHLTSSTHLLTCSHFPLSAPRYINWPFSTQSFPDVCFLYLFFFFFRSVGFPGCCLV